MSMKSKVGTKGKTSPYGLNYPNHNTIIINLISLAFSKIWKKYNEIQLLLLLLLLK